MRSIVTMIAAAGVAAGLIVGTADLSVAQPSLESLISVPITGKGSNGARFAGKLTVLRLEARGQDIVGIGIVSGILERGEGRRLGSVVQGEVELPVRVQTIPALGTGPGQRGGDDDDDDDDDRRRGSSSGGFRHALARPGTMMPDGRVILVQATCQVLRVEIGPVTVDLLGVQIALSPVTLDLSGAAGTPLGGLVAAVCQALTGVGGLLGALTGLLAFLGGLLGGLTGGLGAVIPTI